MDSKSRDNPGYVPEQPPPYGFNQSHNQQPVSPGYGQQPQVVIVQQPMQSGALFGGFGDALDPRPFAGSGVPIVPPSGPNSGAIELLPNVTIPGVPAGLEPLVAMDAIIIKQKVELLEIFAGFETANKYNILNSSGQKIYYAGETTEAAQLCFGGPQRPFEIRIVDFSGRSIMTLKRPCDTALYLSNCCCCCGVIGGECEITLADGTLLGNITHQFNCYQVKYAVTDSSGEEIMTIGGPSCGDCSCCMQCCESCCGREFPVRLKNGTELGKIKKKFSGIQEFVSDADTFGVTFPKDLDVKWKAIMLGAVFLLDFMYFEQPANK